MVWVKCTTAAMPSAPASRATGLSGSLTIFPLPKPWRSAPLATLPCYACSRWEKEGITPDKGDVLVTGAAGGVGSVAIALLDKRGYRVVASSRRAEQEGDYLRELGAD